MIHIKYYYQHLPWTKNLQSLRIVENVLLQLGWWICCKAPVLPHFVFMTWFIDPSWFLLLATGWAQNSLHHGMAPIGTLKVAGSFPGDLLYGQASAIHPVFNVFLGLFLGNSCSHRASYDLLWEFLCCRNYTNSRWLRFHFYIWASIYSGVTLGW